jgi:hypothetical protein
MVTGDLGSSLHKLIRKWNLCCWFRCVPNMDICDDIVPHTTAKRNWMGWVGSKFLRVGIDSTRLSMILIWRVSYLSLKNISQGQLEYIYVHLPSYTH